MDELLAQLMTLLEKNNNKKNVFIVLTGCNLYVEDVYKVLNNHMSQLSLSIWHSDEYREEEAGSNMTWEKIATEVTEKKTLISVIQEADFILIPSISRDLLVKGALCIGDTSSSYALQIALMQKKSILAIDSGINLELDYWKMRGMGENEKYNNSLSLFQEKIIDLGVELITIFDFPKVFEGWITDAPHHSQKERILKPEEQPKKIQNSSNIISSDVITYQDVYGQQEITIKMNAKLTDLAQDYLINNNIPVNRI